MQATRQDWARAYALQALSDLQAREALVEANMEKCHRLHFLQMAAEKACKAHLAWESGHQNLRKTHAYVERVLPILARHFFAATNDSNRIQAWKLEQIKRLAHEIEVIAPACNAGEVREDNSEYPWLDARDEIQIPCRHNFPKIQDR